MLSAYINLPVDCLDIAPVKTLSERLQVSSLVTDFSVALEEPTHKLPEYFAV